MPDIVETRPEIEEYDLPDAAAESDLAAAERLLAGLLVHWWLAGQQECPEALRGLRSQEEQEL